MSAPELACHRGPRTHQVVSQLRFGCVPSRKQEVMFSSMLRPRPIGLARQGFSAFRCVKPQNFTYFYLDNIRLSNPKMETKQDDTNDNTQLESPRGHVSSNGTKKKPPEMDIDPENEVKGIKLLLIHTGICLCTFLVGLVSNN